MFHLSGKRLIAIFTVIFGCVAVTGLTCHPTGYQTDEICHFGFPLTFREYGGFTYRDEFDAAALIGDFGIGLVATHFFYPAIEKRLRPNVHVRPQFHLASLLLTVTVVAILLGLSQWSLEGAHYTQQGLALLAPLTALGFAYFGARWLGQETKLGSFVLLITSMLGLYFLGPTGSVSDKSLILFQSWTLQLWLIWFVWLVDIDQLFPDVDMEPKPPESQESEYDESLV
ncbi:hypothetical protein [Blastopirellula marina]|uniref:DUF998 domain-containing protein n=1 Tax=Blastopirellula marina TaxID=124 RepID=A0A2S8G1A6_9BACT|nr:hypothetical protein [Blastopirellula marina]PQO38223.1 hypothetical protein C5Y98_09130 [Blastopirellula marina]PTL44879.1 hypothetical protein C5Y97_09135 [Blastopirellula marina]